MSESLDFILPHFSNDHQFENAIIMLKSQVARLQIDLKNQQVTAEQFKTLSEKLEYKYTQLLDNIDAALVSSNSSGQKQLNESSPAQLRKALLTKLDQGNNHQAIKDFGNWVTHNQRNITNKRAFFIHSQQLELNKDNIRGIITESEYNLRILEISSDLRSILDDLVTAQATSPLDKSGPDHQVKLTEKDPTDSSATRFLAAGIVLIVLIALIVWSILT